MKRKDVINHLQGLQRATQLSMAAAALGRMRTGYRRNRQRAKPRRWTGRLADGSRAWIGRQVIMPDDVVARVRAIVRGQAVVQWNDPYALDGARLKLFHVELLRI